MDCSESKYINFKEAARQLDVENPPSPDTIWRWCRIGVGLPNGERMTLPYKTVGRKMYTKLEWVREFHEKWEQAKQVARAGTPETSTERRIYKPHLEAALQREGL